MIFRDDLTLAFVSSLLRMDESGVLFWRKTRGHIPAGSRAGNIDKDGYVSVCINKKKYLAHRIVWLLNHGAWPSDRIDHRNRVRTDNRPDNLRVADASGNSQNRNVDKSSCLVPVRGVTLHKGGKYQAQIKHQGRSRYLGLFSTAEQAGEAYREASARLHGDYGVPA